MNKNKRGFAVLTLCMLGGILALGITATRGFDLNSNFIINAALPEGHSSVSFKFSTTSTTAYSADGTHDTPKLSLDNVVNGSNDLITGYSGIDKVYPGNAKDGYGTSTTTLKFGSSKAVGTMTIATNYSVHKVVISYVTWHATNKSQIKVNDVLGAQVARQTFADETFVLNTASNMITISTLYGDGATDRRVGIDRIDLYHRCGA